MVINMSNEERSASGGNKSILITLLIALIVGAGAFYAGMKYQQSKRSTFMQQIGVNGGRAGFRSQNGNGNNLPAGRQDFQPVNGEIISSDDKSITVELQDGSSKIVLLSDSTSINKAESGSKEDLKSGEKVFVIGTKNSDGSVSASSIQLNPPNRVIPQAGNP